MVVSYQPVLVLLSIAVAIIGSLTALALTSGSHDPDSESWETSFSLANGGLVMGTTIWSMRRNDPVDWHCDVCDVDGSLRSQHSSSGQFQHS